MVDTAAESARIASLKTWGRLLLGLLLSALPSWAGAGTATRLILNNDHCTVGPCPAPIPTPIPAASAGEELGIYVAALDSNNGRDIGYAGTVTFTSSDPVATLPSTYTFTQLDQGARGFTAILRTIGLQTITVTDVSGAVLPGTFTLTVTGSGVPAADVPTLTPLMQILLALLLGFIGVFLFRVAK